MEAHSDYLVVDDLHFGDKVCELESSSISPQTADAIFNLKSGWTIVQIWGQWTDSKLSALLLEFRQTETGNVHWFIDDLPNEDKIQQWHHLSDSVKEGLDFPKCLIDYWAKQKMHESIQVQWELLDSSDRI